MKHGSREILAGQSQQLLSVVIPCYNEQEVIDETHRRLTAALAPLAMRLEIIYVDDGSRDDTATCLERIQAADARVRVLLLARNFGHQMAVSAGIDYAQGDAVAIIDADLQDPPEVILEMVGRWRDGFHVVYGQRRRRTGESWFKLLTAAAFYRTLDRLSDTAIPVDTGDFRLIDRRVVDVLKQMPEHDRFLRGMISWVGFRQCPVEYDRAERFAGETKYPLRKMLRLAADGIFSFSLKPLRWATTIGFTATLAGLAATVGGALALLLGLACPPGTFTVGAVLFVGGAQLVSTGILGEYVGRIYRESKQRPLYLVREELGANRATIATPRRHVA